MMFSICALGAALAVRVPSRLDTSVARVAISASEIATGAAGGGGAEVFDGSAFFGSAAPAKIGGGEKATRPAISEEQRNDRSELPALSREAGISFTLEKIHPRVIGNMERKLKALQ